MSEQGAIPSPAVGCVGAGGLSLVQQWVAWEQGAIPSPAVGCE